MNFDRETWRRVSALKKGHLVYHPDSGIPGTLVRTVSFLPIDRDRKPPMVRWHGCIDAEEIDWDLLLRAIREDAVRKSRVDPAPLEKGG